MLFTNKIYKFCSELFIDYSTDSFIKKIKVLFSVFLLPVDPTNKICFWIRLGQHFNRKGNRYITQAIESKIYKSFCCKISCNISIGPKLLLPHPHGIVIGSGCKIGSNVTLYHNTTLGGKSVENPIEYPVIEDNVIVYSGSVIIGKILIGKGTVIGANSVVLHDTAPESTYVGAPATRIK